MLDTSLEFQGLSSGHRVYCGDVELLPRAGERFTWGDRSPGTHLLAAAMASHLLEGGEDADLTAFLVDVLHDQEKSRGWMFSITLIGIFLARANFPLYQKYRELFEGSPETQS